MATQPVLNTSTPPNMDALAPTADVNDPFLELGDTGLKRYSGFISEEWFRQAKGAAGIKLLSEMRDNHPVIGAIIFAITMLARQVTWSVQSGSEDPDDIEIADFVESCFSDMENTFQDMLGSFLTMIAFGWSWHEVVFKVRQGPDEDDPGKRSQYTDKKIGVRKVAIRAQDTLSRWEMDPSGTVVGMWQQPPNGGGLRYIPRERCLHLRAQSYKDNPEGRSAIRNAMIPYLFQKKMMEIEAIGIERDLAGLPVFMVPAKIMMKNANANDKAMFAMAKSIVQNIRRDSQEGIVLPGDVDAQTKAPLYELKLLSTGGTRQMDVDKVIQRYDQRIAMVVLADFITLGNSGAGSTSGSHAMASTKADMFGAAMSAWLDAIAEEMDRHLVPMLLSLNNIKTPNPPKVTHGEVEGPNLQALGAYVTALAGAGVPLFPDANLERYLRDIAGFPDATPDEGMFPGDEDSRINPVIKPNDQQAKAAAVAAQGASGKTPEGGGDAPQPPPVRTTPAPPVGRAQNMPAGVPKKPSYVGKSRVIR